MSLSFIKKQNILTYFFVFSFFISSLAALFLYFESTNILTNSNKASLSFEGVSPHKIVGSALKNAPEEIKEKAITIKNITLSGYALQENEVLIQSQVQPRDTILSLLKGYVSFEHVKKLIVKAKPQHDMANIQNTKKYQIVHDKNGQFLRFEYQRNKDEVFVLAVKNTQNNISATTPIEDIFNMGVQAIAYEAKVVAVKFEIESNLYAAIAKANEKSSLGFAIKEILSNSMDFSNSLKKGSIFKVLVEKKYDGNVFVSYGNILAISLEQQGKSFTVYKFGENTKQNTYYTADGKTLQSSFLDKPLNYTRISSTYSLARRHPILGKVRPHKGIDYAAPMGTPVYAVADAVVNYVGYSGDFGKTVVLRHANGIQTQYAHLSRFNAKTRKNTKVSKGDIIAYVGSTGRSTGPHLDFRVKKSGQYVNPKALASVKGIALTEEQKEAFLLTVSAYNIALSVQ